MKRWCLSLLVFFGLLLVGCGREEGESQESPPPAYAARATMDSHSSEMPGSSVEPTGTPVVDLVLLDSNVSLSPLPLRAGFPFSVTAAIHNNGALPAVDVPVMIYISAGQEEIGYSSFLKVLTVTVPASETLPLEVPVDWNFSGGEHQLWMQVNRLPEAWQAGGSSIPLHPLPVLPEANTGDNIVLRELMVDPFDAYVSDLCPGRVDVEIGPADVLPEPEHQRVLVRVHNAGNRAVYNLPVVVLGDNLSGIVYTPAIPPCGGTAEVYVHVDRAFEQGELLAVQVNPSEWADSLAEDDFDNNQISVVAGLAPGMPIPPGSGLEDYDFGLSAADIEAPETGIVLVTVHNLGTRDAAMVPIRIENAAGRKINDAIPLIQGNGLGVAAIRVGYLWTRGGNLTFTVNPEGARDAYPETNRDNNVAVLALP
jgi:hypothetical protein